MKRYAKIVKYQKQVTIFAKQSLLYVFQGSGIYLYAATVTLLYLLKTW